MESVSKQLESIFSIKESSYDPNKSLEFRFDGELTVIIKMKVSEFIGDDHLEIKLDFSETCFMLEFSEACRNVLTNTFIKPGGLD